MTKISKKSAYPIKNPAVTDYFVGTDSENNNKTVNFGFEETANLINKLNGTLIVNYKFVVSENIPLAVLTGGNFLTEANETSIGDITTLYLNKNNLQEDDLTELFQFIKDNASDFSLKLQNSANLKNTCYFTINSVTDHTDYFAFDVTIQKLNPALNTLQHFNIYFLTFDITAFIDVDLSTKLDKSTYTGNAQDLDDRISDLESPDIVLKIGEIELSGLNVSIAANEFAWRINQEDFLTPLAFSAMLDEATVDYFRSDLLQGDASGNYSIKKGEEGELSSTPPSPDVDKVALKVINIQGDSTAYTGPVQDYSALYLKRYKTTYKTTQAVFNLDPNEDDYNVIFMNSAPSTIKIYPNGSFGKYIKNGAIYPFKSKGTGNVIVNVEPGVTLNVPNNTVLNKNTQCYLIKDDYNEWTLVNPTTSLVDISSKADTTYVDAQDAAKLAEAKAYSDNLVTQLLDGAPVDANTLKELNDKIIALQAIVGGATADGDAIVNTVTELLAVFASFPEGVDLVTLLAGKVNTTDVYNALDCVISGKVADARQLKVLNDLIIALTTTVGSKENTSNKTDVITGNETSSSLYASIKGIVDWFSAAKIRSILGISTLSGENTGDQDLSSYAPLASPDFTGTVTGISKSMVGLADVDNTSDLDKPVSTATQTALDLKLDAADYNDRFKGVYLTLAALNAAHPTANAGDSAQVNETGTTDVLNYSWDAEDEIWVQTGSAGSGATNTDELPEGSTNLYFTTARVLATALAGLSAASGTFTSSDTLLTAFGKIKYLIDNIATTYATLVSPAFTGTPTAPTASVGTNTTQIATTEFVLANLNSNVGLRTFFTTMRASSISLAVGNWVGAATYELNHSFRNATITGLTNGTWPEIAGLVANSSGYRVPYKCRLKRVMISAHRAGTVTFEVAFLTNEEPNGNPQYNIQNSLNLIKCSVSRTSTNIQHQEFFIPASFPTIENNAKIYYAIKGVSGTGAIYNLESILEFEEVL